MEGVVSPGAIWIHSRGSPACGRPVKSSCVACALLPVGVPSAGRARSIFHLTGRSPRVGFLVAIFSAKCRVRITNGSGLNCDRTTF